MTKNIFRSMCAVALAAVIGMTVLVMGVLYGYFSRIQQTQLRMQTQLAAQGVELCGLDYFDGLDIRKYRRCARRWTAVTARACAFLPP